MNKVIISSVALILSGTAAQAGTAPIPVSEPGMLGILAVGAVAAIAVARLRGRK